jgi:hypothetical protein
LMMLSSSGPANIAGNKVSTSIFMPAPEHLYPNRPYSRRIGVRRSENL